MDRAALAQLPLVEFVPALSPEYHAPYHLADFCHVLERCLTEGVRALCSVPIRHFKTQTMLHGIAWLLLRDPTLRIILFTYDHKRAEWLGKRCRQLCDACGVGPAHGYDTIVSWQNDRGGGVNVMSAEQSKLGQDVDILLFDDPLNEQQAYKKEVRDAVDAAIAHYTARVGRPGRLGSVVGVASRWHIDDPIGRRLERDAVRWENIHHAAIESDESGNERAFAPNVMDLEDLRRRRAEWREADPSERGWYAQFQNDPKPDALGLFRKPVQGPAPAYGRYVFGLDLVYSKNKYADYFALVVLKVWQGVGYVINVWRERLDFEMAVDRVRFARRMYPGAAMYSYISGPEKAAITYMEDRGLPVEPLLARAPKYIRARKTIDAWNEGRIICPEQAPWLSGFLLRCTLFTGQEDAGDDDEIDALVSACDGGVFGAGAVPRVFGKPRI